MEKTKLILTRALVTFALVSFGFALGKHSVSNVNNSQASNGNGKYIAVYYMHSSFRCTTCNTIEKMTKELLDSSYSKELANGSMKWQEVDFQKDESLAKKFEVAASCVVVAQFNNGTIVDFKRLDKVWTLMKSHRLFNEYISNAIGSYIKNSGDVK